MNEKRKPEHSFDIAYLRELYDSLSSEFKSQGATLANMDKHMEGINKILEGFAKKNDEQDGTIKEHGSLIHTIEMKQAGCDADTKLVSVFSNIKRLNSFMDLSKKRSSGDIDTRAIDVHAQQMQHAQEMLGTTSIPLRAAFTRMLPWFIIVAVFFVVMTTLVMAQTVTGKSIVLPDAPNIEIPTNSSSQRSSGK